MNLDNNLEYQRFFEETNEIYQESKAYIVILEKYRQEVTMTAINELRNAMFHLYEFIQTPKNRSSDFIKAKEHVYRACFDTFSLLSAFYIAEIGRFDERYGRKVIMELYPKYYHEIRPELSTLINEIAQIRNIRQTSDEPIAEKLPTDRLRVIATLSQIYMTLDSLNGDFTKLFEENIAKERENERKDRLEEEEKRKNAKRELLLKILIPSIAFILGAILTYVSKKYW